MKNTQVLKFTIIALAVVYIVFGFLKVIDKSAVKDMVLTLVPFMKNGYWFQVLGIFEIVLGVALVVKKTRLYAATGIILHLLFIFLVSIFGGAVIYSAITFLTLQGEFVVKNLVLIAAALHIVASEWKGKKLPTISWRFE